MKSKVLLILSICCILAALILMIVAPVLADSESAQITKSQTPPVNGKITSTITVTNTNPAGGHTQDYFTIIDTIMHNNQPPLTPPEASPNLLTALPSTVTLGGGATMAGGVVTLLPGGHSWVSVTYTWTVRSGDVNTTVMDIGHAEGYPTGFGPYPSIILQIPNWDYVPLPELSAGILFGMGTIGLGGFVWIRRRKAATVI
jgi:hypothetical protein